MLPINKRRDPVTAAVKCEHDAVLPCTVFF